MAFEVEAAKTTSAVILVLEVVDDLGAVGDGGLVVTQDEGLAGELRRGRHRILILSDPDLLSNHGLRRGDNAVLAVRLIDHLRPAGGAVSRVGELDTAFPHRNAELMLVFVSGWGDPATCTSTTGASEAPFFRAAADPW